MAVVSSGPPPFLQILIKSAVSSSSVPSAVLVGSSHPQSFASCEAAASLLPFFAPILRLSSSALAAANYWETALNTTVIIMGDVATRNKRCAAADCMRY
jgi:hypothetical protein